MPLAVNRAGFEGFAGRDLAARNDMCLGLGLNLRDLVCADDNQLAGLRVVGDIGGRGQAVEQPRGDIRIEIDLAEGAAILGIGGEIIGAAIRFDGDMAERDIVAHQGTADLRHVRRARHFDRLVPALHFDVENRLGSALRQADFAVGIGRHTPDAPPRRTLFLASQAVQQRIDVACPLEIMGPLRACDVELPAVIFEFDPLDALGIARAHHVKLALAPLVRLPDGQGRHQRPGRQQGEHQGAGDADRKPPATWQFGGARRT